MCCLVVHSGRLPESPHVHKAWLVAPCTLKVDGSEPCHTVGMVAVYSTQVVGGYGYSSEAANHEYTLVVGSHVVEVWYHSTHSTRPQHYLTTCRVVVG